MSYSGADTGFVGLNAVLGDLFKKTELPGMLERACMRDPKAHASWSHGMSTPAWWSSGFSVLSCHLRELVQKADSHSGDEAKLFLTGSPGTLWCRQL